MSYRISLFGKNLFEYYNPKSMGAKETVTEKSNGDTFNYTNCVFDRPVPILLKNAEIMPESGEQRSDVRDQKSEGSGKPDFLHMVPDEKYNAVCKYVSKNTKTDENKVREILNLSFDYLTNL